MFCDECGRNVIAGTENRIRKVMIHGISIPVHYKAYVCGACGTELLDDDVEDYVMRIAREQFRTKKNMLPADLLRAYMKKNSLSAAQMAEKTGCAVGEIIAASKGVLLDPGADTKIKRAMSA